MTYPIPMQVHVIWHPDSDATCRPIAEYIYLALNRDPQQPLLPGICMPVFFRCAGAVPGDRSGAPRSIEIGDTFLDLRIALITPHFVMDPNWMAYLAQCDAEVSKRPSKAVLLIFDFSRGGIVGERLALRLDPKLPELRERVLQHVLLQCCRLLSRRVGEGQMAEHRGAAPLKLFLSHTKRDGDGLLIASKLKHYLDTLAVERFFDEVSIQPGTELSQELKAGIADAALICIRSDGYVSSPWCRKELLLGKKERRPMVVLDALSRQEARSSPLLSHLPSIRVDVHALDLATLENIVNFVAREAVRFLYANLQLKMLQTAGIVPTTAVLLTRPPEPRDIATLKDAGDADGEPAMFLHPDPRMSAEELSDLSGSGVAFMTPTSLWQERLDGLRLGLSVSPGDSAEQESLGLSLHVEDAMRVIARQALAAGATLHYGGTLTAGSLTQALFDMICAFNRDGLKFPQLVNYTAWPWYEDVDVDWLAEHVSMLSVVQCDAPPDALAQCPSHHSTVPELVGTPAGRYAMGRSLSEMRKRAVSETEARVLLGGKPHGFMGFLPGVVEEALLAIRAKSPVYVLGGFGGAARLVAEALSGNRPHELTREYQSRMSPGYAQTLEFYDHQRAQRQELQLPPVEYEEVVSEFNRLGVASLVSTNGLNEAENRFLFATASVDAGLYLIMKGLTKMVSARQ